MSEDKDVDEEDARGELSLLVPHHYPIGGCLGASRCLINFNGQQSVGDWLVAVQAEGPVPLNALPVFHPF